MKKIINWAHRGASGHAPENTLSAFHKAMEMEADGIELDIRESREGDLVVFHDPTIKRFTRRSERVNQLSTFELKNIDIGSWFSPDFAGEGIPRLTEVIEQVPAPFLLNLEMKAASPQKVVDLIQQKGISDRVILSAFDHSLLAKLRSLDFTLALGYLVDREPWKNAFREAMKLGAVSLNVPSKRATPQLINQVHREGLKVYLYTVNDVEQMAAFMKMGVDGLFTNYPDRLSALQDKKD